MEHPIQIFENEAFGRVRVMEINSLPWWVLKDVCAALGLNSPHKVAERLDEDERNQIPVIDGIGRNQLTTMINESGLYAVILRSDKPKAKAFRRWITTEVLPSIRRHGAYLTEDTLEKALRSSSFTAELLNSLLMQREENTVLRERIEVLTPKARYYDRILQSRNAVQVSVIAKDYGMTAVSFNRLLHELGIQYKLGSTWLLYQPYAGKGYTCSRTYQVNEERSVMHTYWTQAGRLFLYKMLKENGVISLMEDDDAANA
ncbi:phage antirepressor protein KilAC domain protein [Oxobacter pfennigii]|uniref:Phage antirepressor protein KilAC domain protein n=1 Tax=Oxobacter pfennigii TaxID=36849 RepID=A0A0P8WBJ6_9CLOT|nr:phage antirepressor KilAC domain-containing protein [Oxobacter pfennigii]KPU45092.1 phage antirepressor protein KilAC domain protein [Oxobacter pfennigii]